MARSALWRKSVKSVPEQTVPQSRPASHGHLCSGSTMLNGTMTVESASPKQTQANAMMNRTFQAGMRVSRETAKSEKRKAQSPRQGACGRTCQHGEYIEHFTIYES